MKFSDNNVVEGPRGRLLPLALGLSSGIIVLLGLAGPDCAVAEAGEGEGEASIVSGNAPDPDPQKVDLSRLLKLPNSYQYSVESRAGADEEEWRMRFVGVETDLSEAKGALSKAKEELGEVASTGGSYSVSAPGTTTNPEDTPLSYKLRQEIRRQREMVERAEYKLRDLQIEADIAGVPQQWRSAEEGTAPAD